MSPGPVVNTARDAEMLQCREAEKLTYRQIGERYGISAERVRQLINRAIRKRRHRELHPNGS